MCGRHSEGMGFKLEIDEAHPVLSCFFQIILIMLFLSLIVFCLWLSCTDAGAVMARQQAEHRIVNKVQNKPDVLNYGHCKIKEHHNWK